MGAHQVLLVREQDGQHSGSGCCGRLGGCHTELGAAADFSHSRARMLQIGEVYRALRACRPALDVVVVDPRNVVWLYPTVWRSARRDGLGRWAALRSMARAGSPMAVVVDGDTLFAGRLPPTEQVVGRILERIDRRFDA
ncbi:hypothetical protein [Salinisphaera sp. T31B1]|uniref:hypothetical protein n=1 Tax=Salinisphaera sp. T31B1 TaxID=727963 RepID=UPI00333EA25B